MPPARPMARAGARERSQGSDGKRNLPIPVCCARGSTSCYRDGRTCRRDARRAPNRLARTNRRRAIRRGVGCGFAHCRSACRQLRNSGRIPSRGALDALGAAEIPWPYVFSNPATTTRRGLSDFAIGPVCVRRTQRIRSFAHALVVRCGTRRNIRCALTSIKHALRFRVNHCLCSQVVFVGNERRFSRTQCGEGPTH